MSTDGTETPTTTLVTRPERGLTPAALAEQQRAITEVQAALQVAKMFPRDEQEAIERIEMACSRPEVALNSSYLYSRGGEEITGPNIRLLEIVAQQWGNLDFGFREIARYHGAGGQAGESVVEAFAWDLQSNTRRKVQVTIRHEMEVGPKGQKRMKPLTDPRDIYEHIANQVQRRVRTCLENIVPRDVVDRALRKCEETAAIKWTVTPDLIKKMLDGFSGYGISRGAIERKLQRSVESLTPAQYERLSKIFRSLKDHMGQPADYFDLDEPEAATGTAAKPAPNTGAEKAKAAMKGKQAAAKPTTAKEPVREPDPPTRDEREAGEEPSDDLPGQTTLLPEDDQPSTAPAPNDALVNYLVAFDCADTVEALGMLFDQARTQDWSADDDAELVASFERNKARLRPRGTAANRKSGK